MNLHRFKCWIRSNFIDRPIDLKLICDIEMDGIDMSDYPDFTDAYISAATWSDTLKELSDSELEELNTYDDLVYDETMAVVF